MLRICAAVLTGICIKLLIPVLTLDCTLFKKSTNKKMFTSSVYGNISVTCIQNKTISSKIQKIHFQPALINPFCPWVVVGPMFQSALRGARTNFVIFIFIGTSVIKSFERSRIFRYGLPKDILSKGKNSEPM